MFSRMGSAAFKKDLHNIRMLCHHLGDPQDQFRTIHVGGTNGKGSVCHLLSAILQEAGYKTGLHTAVARELVEETGYEFEEFIDLGKISANPATTNNYMHMFLATGGEKKREQKLDETEDVEVILCSIDEVKQMLRDRSIVQALHTSCIFFALERLGELSY